MTAILIVFDALGMFPKGPVAQFARAVEYTDCISAVGLDSPPSECPRYDTKQSDGEVPVILWQGPIYGLNRTNGILMLNWIVWLNWIAWNRNVLTIKPYLHLNCVLMLNLIIWNELFFDIETVLTQNWIV